MFIGRYLNSCSIRWTAIKMAHRRVDWVFFLNRDERRWRWLVGDCLTRDSNVQQRWFVCLWYRMDGSW